MQIPLGVTLFIMMVLLLLSACTSVTIHDSIWYGSKGSKGAIGFHTLTAGTERLTNEKFIAKWNNLKSPMIATTADTFADLKRALEQLCSIQTCNYLTTDQKSILTNFFTNVDNLVKGP